MTLDEYIAGSDDYRSLTRLDAVLLLEEAIKRLTELRLDRDMWQQRANVAIAGMDLAAQVMQAIAGAGDVSARISG